MMPILFLSGSTKQKRKRWGHKQQPLVLIRHKNGWWADRRVRECFLNIQHLFPLRVTKYLLPGVTCRVKNVASNNSKTSQGGAWPARWVDFCQVLLDTSVYHHPNLASEINRALLTNLNSCDQVVVWSLTAAHLALPGRVQQLEACQPYARLRVHVDFHSARCCKPEQPLHLAHPTTEATGLPDTSTSTHSEDSPHLLLCVTLQAHAPRQSTPTPAASSVRVKITLCNSNFYSAFRILQPHIW